MKADPQFLNSTRVKYLGFFPSVVTSLSSWTVFFLNFFAPAAESTSRGLWKVLSLKSTQLRSDSTRLPLTDVFIREFVCNRLVEWYVRAERRQLNAEQLDAEASPRRIWFPLLSVRTLE